MAASEPGSRQVISEEVNVASLKKEADWSSRLAVWCSDLYPALRPEPYHLNGPVGPVGPAGQVGPVDQV